MPSHRHLSSAISSLDSQKPSITAKKKWLIISFGFLGVIGCHELYGYIGSASVNVHLFGGVDNNSSEGCLLFMGGLGPNDWDHG